MNNFRNISINCIAKKLESITNNIIIVGHKNADYDSMCSSLSLAYGLKKLIRMLKYLLKRKA